MEYLHLLIFTVAGLAVLSIFYTLCCIVLLMNSTIGLVGLERAKLVLPLGDIKSVLSESEKNEVIKSSGYSNYLKHKDRVVSGILCIIGFFTLVLVLMVFI